MGLQASMQNLAPPLPPVPKAKTKTIMGFRYRQEWWSTATIPTLVGLDMDGPRSPNTPASTLRLWVAQRTPVRMLQRQHARKQTVVWQCTYQYRHLSPPILTKQGIKHADLLWTSRGSSGFVERPGCACYCFQRWANQHCLSCPKKSPLWIYIFRENPYCLSSTAPMVPVYVLCLSPRFEVNPGSCLRVNGNAQRLYFYDRTAANCGSTDSVRSNVVTSSCPYMVSNEVFVAAILIRFFESPCCTSYINC